MCIRDSLCVVEDESLFSDNSISSEAAALFSIDDSSVLFSKCLLYTSIKEHKAQLDGVGIEESTIRVYNDSIYFAPIIGYTGKVQEDQLEELKKSDPDYELTDVVGRTGIELSLIHIFSNTKILGAKTLFATHYHELTELEGTLNGVNNYCIAVKEQGRCV